MDCVLEGDHRPKASMEDWLELAWKSPKEADLIAKFSRWRQHVLKSGWDGKVVELQ